MSVLFDGLSLGAIYALIALGYTMVYGIAKMLNFAHGDIIMVGAYAIFVTLSMGGHVAIACFRRKGTKRITAVFGRDRAFRHENQPVVCRYTCRRRNNNGGAYRFCQKDKNRQSHGCRLGGQGRGSAYGY